MADPRPVVDSLIREGDDAFYSNERELTEGHFNQRLDLAIHHLGSLIEDARAQSRELPVDLVSFQQLDSSGNATFPVYQVGAGFLLEIDYMVVECATFDASNARTPASPYTNASFWLGIFSSPNDQNVAQGGLIDFLPTTAAAQGLPAVGEYLPPRMVRSQQWIVCKVVSGPASQRLSVRLGGHLRANG